MEAKEKSYQSFPKTKPNFSFDVKGMLAPKCRKHILLHRFLSMLVGVINILSFVPQIIEDPILAYYVSLGCILFIVICAFSLTAYDYKKELGEMYSRLNVRYVRNLLRNVMTYQGFLSHRYQEEYVGDLWELFYHLKEEHHHLLWIYIVFAVHFLSMVVAVIRMKLEAFLSNER